MPAGGAMVCGATAAATTPGTSASSTTTQSGSGKRRVGRIRTSSWSRGRARPAGSAVLLEGFHDLREHLAGIAEDEGRLGIVVQLVVDAGEPGVQAPLDE